jgi:hypothetical protein
VVRGNETLEGGKNWAIEMAGFQGTYHGETSTILSRCAKDTPVMDAATQSLGDVFLRAYAPERELEGDTVQLEQQGYVVWSGWVAGKDIGAIYVVAERCEEPSLRWHFGSAFENVRDTVNRYDPYGLLHAGAPSDEYEAEIGEILVRLQGVTSETDAMRLIRNVFARTLAAPPTEAPASQCNISPASPANGTSTGSLTLKRQSRTNATTVMTPDFRSITACLVSTMVAPAIAPAAAAVAPLTNALICGLSWCRINHRPGSTTPR